MPNKNRTRLKIITPNGIFYDQDVSIVTVKTTEGYIGIQSGRIPIVTSIEISPLVMGTKGAESAKIKAEQTLKAQKDSAHNYLKVLKFLIIQGCSTPF